jgi:hypothetical protein
LDSFFPTLRVSSDGTAGGVGLGIVTPGTQCAPDVWSFVVAWHDSVANTINVQVNNGTVASAAWAHGVKAGNAAFTVGGGWTGGATTSNLEGEVDSVSFWHRTLTTAERTTLYNSGAGLDYPFPGAPVSGICCVLLGHDTLSHFASGANALLFDSTYAHADVIAGAVYANGQYAGPAGLATKPGQWQVLALRTNGNVTASNLGNERNLGTTAYDLAEVQIYNAGLKNSDFFPIMAGLVAKYLG